MRYCFANLRGVACGIVLGAFLGAGALLLSVVAMSVQSAQAGGGYVAGGYYDAEADEGDWRRNRPRRGLFTRSHRGRDCCYSARRDSRRGYHRSRQGYDRPRQDYHGRDKWRHSHRHTHKYSHRHRHVHQKARGYYQRSGPQIGGYIGVPYKGYGFSDGYYYRKEYVPVRQRYVQQPYAHKPYRHARKPYRHARRAHARPKPWSLAWYGYCRNKYRSFNPQTGRYLAYSGRYRMCR